MRRMTDSESLPRLLRVAQHLSEQKDVPRLLSALLKEVRHLCHADTGWVWLYTDGRPQAGLNCLCHDATVSYTHLTLPTISSV